MDLEGILVRALNRKRPIHTARPSGLLLGTGERLIGQGSEPFSITATPVHHSLAVGRTGSGKSTLLLRLMAEYHRVGIPFLFIDLHGQATDELLAMIASRKE
jgi:DNA helicase HerA-like ATPase